MPSEQEREFELVLGNKQLFSVLFIVIVLLAVFFSMGYVMGRNSAPTDVARRTDGSLSSDAASSKRSATDSPSAPVRSAPAPTNSYPLPTPSDSTPATPAAQAPTATTPAPAPAAVKPLEIAPVSVAEPQPGQSYWQVSAVAKPEAELLVEVLTKKGFRAIVAAGPNEKLFRVLVGPAKDPADVSKLRVDLEQAGFKPYLRKY